jgi:hypothetical protein
MATIRVTNQTQLLSALKTATGGDTILLANGDYGDVTLKNQFSTTVTLKAEHDDGATFSSLTLTAAKNITVDGLHFEDGFTARNGSSNITVQNCDSDNLLYFRDVSNLTVNNSTATGGTFGILLNSVQNFKVTNNTFGKVTEDVMRITGNSYGGLIENNTIGDTIAQKPTHPDLIQMFSVDGVTPHDITIRGNLLYDDPVTGDSNTAAQGIFMANAGIGGYKNILIEDNLIYTRSANTIFVGGGQENVVIKNNTLMSSTGDGGGIIRLSSVKGFDNSGTSVTGNIAKLVLDETGESHITGNYFYGRNADLSKLFQGTDGTLWKSFLPVSGSAIDLKSGYGASHLLKDLLADQGPTKTPVPATAPAADSSDTVTNVFHTTKDYELTGKKAGLLVVSHDSDMALQEGSIGLTFNADTVSGNRGLISKGAAGMADDFSAWIQNGNLVVCFENEAGNTSRITAKGVTANVDHDLLISFEDGKIQVWLDNSLVGTSNFDFDLSGNREALVIGGVNGQSDRGSINKVSSFFDGTISDVAVYDHALTPTEFHSYQTLAHAADTALMSATSDTFYLTS